MWRIKKFALDEYHRIKSTSDLDNIEVMQLCLIKGLGMYLRTQGKDINFEVRIKGVVSEGGS